jgi:hypothetical protein
MEDEVETIVQGNVPRGDLLHYIEREIYERPEKIDDSEGEKIGRSHIVPGCLEPGEVVVEEPVVEDTPVRGEA